jgi:hypothetical protein
MKMPGADACTWNGKQATWPLLFTLKRDERMV